MSAVSIGVPTKLTILRVCLTFLIVGLLFLPGWLAKAVALGLFLLASLTDWLDGYLARRWHQLTAFGALLDPIADKVLILGVFLAFVRLDLVPAWMVMVMLGRELAVTGMRLAAARGHGVIPAAQEGKQKTVAQMVTASLTLCFLVIRERFPRYALGTWEVWMHPVIFWCMWITVAWTLLSGLSFFWRNRALLLHAASR